MSTDMRSVTKAKMAAMYEDDLDCGFVSNLPGPESDGENNVDYEYDEVYELPGPT